MVAKLDIHGVHTVVDEPLKKYITKKINKLEKYIPPHIRSSVHVEVYAAEQRTHGGKQCEVEAVFHLPKDTIRVLDATINMYAAVDIVEEKLKLALVRYKETHEVGKKERHLLNRAQTNREL